MHRGRDPAHDRRSVEFRIDIVRIPGMPALMHGGKHALHDMVWAVFRRDAHVVFPDARCQRMDRFRDLAPALGKAEIGKDLIHVPVLRLQIEVALDGLSVDRLGCLDLSDQREDARFDLREKFIIALHAPVGLMIPQQDLEDRVSVPAFAFDAAGRQFLLKLDHFPKVRLIFLVRRFSLHPLPGRLG